MIELRPLVQPSPMPQVFRDIINNHAAQAAIFTAGFDMTQGQWRKLGRLRGDMRQNLRPSAERALSWNADKGQTP